MKRRLLNVVTVLSLLLCAVLAALWVLSARRADNVGRERFVMVEGVPVYDQWYAYSSAGTIELGRLRQLHLDLAHTHLPGIWKWFRRDRPYGSFSGRMRTPTPAERLGFGYRDERAEVLDEDGTRVVSVRRHRSFTLPYWLLVAAAATLPLARAAPRLARRLRRRAPGGHCAVCGYDLRATTDRCPECGTATDHGSG